MAGRRLVPEEVASAVRRLPGWALITVGIAVLAVAAEVTYLVASTRGGADEPQAERLPCNKRAATNAVEGEFARAVRGLGTVPPLSEVLEVYDARVVGCADLTGDGAEEMVVQLAEPGLDLTGDEDGEEGAAEADGEDADAESELEGDPAAPPPPIADPASPWAIYVVREQRWAPAMIRAGAERAAVEIGDGEVTETSPGLAAGDPACCPSHERVGTVRWREEEFVYRPRGGPRGRTIALADGQAATLAGFDLRSGGLLEAIEHFGPASSYARAGPLCTALWRDLGLELDLSAAGGLDPCGPDGSVVSVRVQGDEAAHMGWKTQEEATIGIPEEELAELYPDMAEVEEDEQAALGEDGEGRLFALVVGETGAAPVLAARIGGDGVLGFEISVIAAPDPAATAGGTTAGEAPSGETTPGETTPGEPPAP